MLDMELTLYQAKRGYKGECKGVGGWARFALVTGKRLILVDQPAQIWRVCV